MFWQATIWSRGSSQPRRLSRWKAHLRLRRSTPHTGARGEEGCGVSDELGKDDLRGAHHELIRAECGILNPHGLTRGPDRLPDERAVVNRSTVQGSEKPGEDHDPGIEEVDRVAHHDAQQIERLRDQCRHVRVLALGERSRQPSRLGGAQADRIQQLLLGDLGLEASVPTALAGVAAGPHEGVAELPRVARGSGQQSTAGKHTTADAAGPTDDV